MVKKYACFCYFCAICELLNLKYFTPHRFSLPYKCSDSFLSKVAVSTETPMRLKTDSADIFMPEIAQIRKRCKKIEIANRN